MYDPVFIVAILSARPAARAAANFSLNQIVQRLPTCICTFGATRRL
jgi:hypothetical protein